jgi:hypothetical protein
MKEEDLPKELKWWEGELGFISSSSKIAHVFVSKTDSKCYDYNTRTEITFEEVKRIAKLIIFQ